MSFLQQLGTARQQGDQAIDSIAKRVVNQFKAECLERAKHGLSSCEFSDGHGFFTANKAGFPSGAMNDGGYLERFLKSLQKFIEDDFGDQATLAFRNRYGNNMGANDLANSCTPYHLYLMARFPKQASSVEQQSRSRSNVVQQCCICMEKVPVIALAPCGHLLCTICAQRFGAGANCPVCRQQVQSHQDLFGS
eukprot:TRINITY_DN78812_c0_g1_i1.p1 TRINITY_DN78812_c0_g1~~TRINITY_DN78812_c0_g1_i1.p1  ORF type:complete len:193 (-),score=27.96 TRINITY_DN78812_c0_g1_i1:210-788(-)